LERELAILYQAYNTGKDNPLTPLSFQYRDYTDWQNRLIQSDSLKEHQIYWTEKMKDLPVNDLPTDHIRSISKTYNGKTMHFCINAGLFEQVKSTAKANDATLFMTLLTASYMLLHHYSGQEDIIMGTPVAGRQHSDLENQVGFYLNTLALRAKVNGQETLKSLLRQTREVVLEAFNHQIYPFDHLLEDILVNQGESRMAVFDVLIALQNTEPDQKHEDFQFEEYGYAATTTSRFDLTFIFTENSSAQNLEACIEYNTDLFIDATIRSLADNFLHIIQILVQEPDLDLSQISWQSDLEEKEEADEFLRLMHTIN
jgi:non-ribosomal peptide synthetase component F